MGRLIGLMGLLVVVALGAYLYSRQAQSSIGGTNAAAPTAIVNVIGVKGDLLALASAELGHFALEGKYVSLDELLSSGDITVKARSRGSCSYDASTTETTFKITATCSGQARPGTPIAFSIDETMQIHSD